MKSNQIESNEIVPSLILHYATAYVVLQRALNKATTKRSLALSRTGKLNTRCCTARTGLGARIIAA